MKIETKQKMNLPELIQYVIDKGWNSYQVTSDNGVDVYFSYSNKFVICDNSSISLDDTFTVEVEEELTEETRFDYLIELYKWSDKSAVAKWQNESIKGLRNNNIKNEYTEKIWALNNDDLVLIWSRESGIPESGVLEVSE